MVALFILGYYLVYYFIILLYGLLFGLSLKVKVDEQESVVRELESSLQQASSESDRKLTKLQQEYERKVQLLVRKLSEKETGETKIKTTAALGDGPVSADNEIRESRQIMKDAR